jgi:hypothetical protein
MKPYGSLRPGIVPTLNGKRGVIVLSNGESTAGQIADEMLVRPGELARRAP